MSVFLLSTRCFMLCDTPQSRRCNTQSSQNNGSGCGRGRKFYPATLRRLIDEARRKDDPRRGQDAAYQVMLALAGLAARIADWPKDIRAYVLRLAG